MDRRGKQKWRWIWRCGDVAKSRKFRPKRPGDLRGPDCTDVHRLTTGTIHRARLRCPCGNEQRGDGCKFHASTPFALIVGQERPRSPADFSTGARSRSLVTDRAPTAHAIGDGIAARLLLGLRQRRQWRNIHIPGGVTCHARERLIAREGVVSI
jgi:hypothetical protein